MLDLIQQIQRLKELRQLARQIQNESEQIRGNLLRIVKSVGGKLIVGSYVLSASAVQVVPYAKVLDEIKKNHPELSHEIEALIERFKTNAERLDIAEKEN
jgi:DNA repair ATPase RecN